MFIRRVRVKTRDRPRVAADTRDTFTDWNGKMRIVSTLVVLLLGAAVPASAQEWPRLNVFGGAQFADFTTDVQLDASATVLGSSVDFERDLDFDNRSSMGWAGGLWRISKRNQLTVGYVYVGRDVVQRQLQRSIRFGNETFDVNANVDAFINTWYLSASYRFAIVATPVVELGASIGITAINLSTGIQLSGSVSRYRRRHCLTGHRRRCELHSAGSAARSVRPRASASPRDHPRRRRLHQSGLR